MTMPHTRTARAGSWRCTAATALVTAVVAAATALAPPAAAAAAAADEAAGPGRADGLHKLRARGQVVVGYRATSVPFSYLGPEGKPQGFAWELCGRVAELLRRQLGLARLDVVPMMVSSQTRLALVQNGSVDLECGSTSNTPSRREQVDFSVNYFYTGTAVMTRAAKAPPAATASANPVVTAGGHPPGRLPGRAAHAASEPEPALTVLANLRGKRVASTTGSTAYQLVRKLNGEQQLGLTLVGVPDHANAVGLLQRDEVQAFAMDEVLLTALRAVASRPEELVISSKPMQLEAYAIALRKGDAPLKQAVDQALRTLMANGEFEALYARWFLQPIPPRGVTLGLPMSAALRANLKNGSDQPVQ